jgi:hypothetical protein
MRGIEILLLAGFIGLVGVGVWNARQWLPQWGTKAANYTPVDAGSSGPPGSKSDKTARGHGKRGLDSRNGSSSRSELALNGFPLSETEVDVPMPKFPIRSDFPRGTTGVQVRARYGEPTARTTEMRDGHLFEHYYYFNNDRTQLTMATLENGVIVSSESTAQ